VFFEEHHGVGVIVRNHAATRFYVQQKDADYRPHPRGYSLFGGAVDPGEAPGEALARELLEELGEAPSAALLAAGPTLVADHGQLGFRFSLFEVVVDDALLDRLATTAVLEGERGAVVDGAELTSLPFVWGLEAVVRDYLAGLTRS